MNAHLPPPDIAAGSSGLVLSAADVAILLNVTTSTFYTRRNAMERAGFPKKLPGICAWSRPAILRWIETNGETYLPADLAHAPAGAASALEAEYGA